MPRPKTTTTTMQRYFHKELEEIRSKLILIGEKANEAGGSPSRASSKVISKRPKPP